MIQVVTFDGKDTRYNCEEVVQYSLHDIRSLDEYEIDVIDLSSSYIWRSDGKTESNVNVSKDLNSIVRMIKNSKTAYVVIVLPQNETFYYYKYDFGGICGNLSCRNDFKMEKGISVSDLIAIYDFHGNCKLSGVWFLIFR